MALDPTDYDVDELRGLAGEEDFDDAVFEPEVKEYGFLWSSPSAFDRLGAEDPTPEQHRRMLDLEEVDPAALGEKPYLEALPDAAEPLAVEWLEFLVGEAGFDGAVEAVDRYASLGWVTESVAERLDALLMGVGHRDGDGLRVLDDADHLLSFAYVAKLTAVAREGAGSVPGGETADGD